MSERWHQLSHRAYALGNDSYGCDQPSHKDDDLRLIHVEGFSHEPEDSSKKLFTNNVISSNHR